MSKNRTLLTSREVYERLQMSRSGLTRLVQGGHLTPTTQLPGKNGALLFNEDDVEALAAARTAEAEKKAAVLRATSPALAESEAVR